MTWEWVVTTVKQSVTRPTRLSANSISRYSEKVQAGPTWSLTPPPTVWVVLPAKVTLLLLTEPLHDGEVDWPGVVTAAARGSGVSILGVQ